MLLYGSNIYIYIYIDTHRHVCMNTDGLRSTDTTQLKNNCACFTQKLLSIILCRFSVIADRNKKKM